MKYGFALEEVKTGKVMRLPYWPDDVQIKGQFPDENSKMSAPYLYVESQHGKVPWVPTMIEMFSNEWELI